MRAMRLLRATVVGFMAVCLALGATASTARGAQAGDESRASLIARSKVWLPTDIASKDLKVGPTGPGSFSPDATVTCDYEEEDFSGASPKFACELPDGDELKVKYGGNNGEVYGEVLASRLLWALGFGADRMYSVRIICRGCPPTIGGVLRPNGDRIIDPAAVERKHPGRELEDAWDWREVEGVDASVGGATVAERDAFKLLAVFIHHTDSKPEQQRIVCVDKTRGEDAACDTPLMMINDLGLTFGRSRAFNQQPEASVHLEAWSATPVWKDAALCVGNLPGSVTGTLKHPVISDAGRRFLADLLTQLSDRQLHDLFEAARVHLRPRNPGSGRSGFPTIGEWVDAFKAKRAQIVDHRCPS